MRDICVCPSSPARPPAAASGHPALRFLHKIPFTFASAPCLRTLASGLKRLANVAKGTFREPRQGRIYARQAEASTTAYMAREPNCRLKAGRVRSGKRGLRFASGYAPYMPERLWSGLSIKYRARNQRGYLIICQPARPRAVQRLARTQMVNVGDGQKDVFNGFLEYFLYKRSCGDNRSIFKMVKIQQGLVSGN